MSLTDCKYVLACYRQLQLLGNSPHSGPYILKVGRVPVGSFGFNQDTAPLAFVDVPGHYQQMVSLGMAYRAFQLAKEQYPSTDDPVEAREAGRAAARCIKQSQCLKLMTTFDGTLCR
jgi:hypothetical protein